MGSNYLKYADIITHIDRTDVRNMDEESFINLCNGEFDTQAELTVLRTGNEEPIKITMKRKHPHGCKYGKKC